MTEPPAVIERKAELAGLDLPAEPEVPPEVLDEVLAARRDVDALRGDLLTQEGVRRFATESLQKLRVPTGISNGYYFADRLVLSAKRGGFEWAWSVTPHYPLVDRIPPDSTYVARAFDVAHQKIKELILPEASFEERLLLAWQMARRVSRSDDVRVVDVMKMYQVAGQDDKFWQNPRRVYYKDLPEAAFVVNLLQWKSSATAADAGFTFVPATLNQASGKAAKVFYMPMNAEGTEVRPMIYLRRTSKEIRA